jgi:hypothetical protein|tara:strand:+ start:17614 stop:17889 length:276 start_codon:yes stop_codon:yes gene_type:complete
MNKKGAGLVFVGIMTAIVVFITIVQFIGPIKDQVIIARDPTNLDCENSSISVGAKATCVITDLYLFYFFSVGVGLSIAFIGARKLASHIQQ